MDPTCLAHRLTDEERQFFDEQGYLVVENALDAATTSQLLKAVDRVDARERTDENRRKLLSVTNIVHEDPALVDLIDLPTTFPKVWGILGWNIYLYHSHIDITPPADEQALTWRVAWHQDSMRVNDELETHPGGRRRTATRVAQGAFTRRGRTHVARQVPGPSPGAGSRPKFGAAVK